MKNQITIRRSGCFLPTLALVVIFLLVSALLWLSTVGLPQAATDYLTAKVKEETGLTLKVEKIKLNPFRGLGITLKGVELVEPGLPIVQIKKATASLDWDDIATGRFNLPKIKIQQADIILPVNGSADQLLALSKLDLDAELRCPQNARQLHLNGSGNLQGINLRFTAIFPISESTQKSTEPLDIKQSIADIKEQIHDIAPQLQQAYDEIDRQHWSKPPTLVVLYSEESDQPTVNVAAVLPSYDWQDIHFHDAQLLAEKRGAQIQLKRLAFATTDPDTVFESSADCNLDSRQAAFNVISTVSFVKIAQKHLGEEAPEWLQNIHHEDGATPRIKLKGDTRLSESYEIEHLRFEGEMEQQGFSVNDSIIESVSAGFYYEDGNLHLDNLHLALPDEGNITLTARLKDGQGEATLQLNSDIDYLLHLANQFTQLTLPDGMELQGHTALELQINLNTPPFVPGKTEWQALIPTITAIQCSLNTDHVAAEGTTVEKPTVRLTAKGMTLPCNHLTECSIEQVQLYASADRVTYDKVALTHPVFQAGTFDLSVTAAEDVLKAVLESTTGELTIRKLTYDTAVCDNLSLNIELPYGWDSTLPVQQQQGGLHLRLESPSFVLGEEFRAERLSADATLNPATKAAEENSSLSLSADINGQPLTLQLPFGLTEQALTIRKAEFTCSPAELQPLLQYLDADTMSEVNQYIRLPQYVNLSIVKGAYSFAENRLLDTMVALSIPELVRTPNTVPALRGKEETVGLNTALTIRQEKNGDFLYGGNLQVTHTSGCLDTEVEGNIASFVHVTGSNTIFADAIDRLIDDEDAHTILRDFRFTPGKSKLRADKIDTVVTYNNGLCVKVHCDADLIDIEYLQSAYEDREEGGEMREVYAPGVTDASFTLFSNAHCGVEVEVLLDRKDTNGNPIPDVQTIKLTHPLLVSDNSRYFTRNKQDGKGFKEKTSLTGDSILFDIEHDTLTLNNLKGDAYPDYTLGAFFLPLREYLSGIQLIAPALLETKQCVFPIAHDCQTPMSGVICVKIPRNGRYNLQGTVIPVEQFSGFINLYDDHVYLDKMNAATWGGVLNGQLSIGFDDTLPAFDGYFTARAMNLRSIAKTFDADFKPATCDATFRFRAQNSELNSIEGYGTANVRDGDLMEFPLFSPIAYVITHLPEFIADKAADSVQKVTGRKVSKKTPAPQPEEEKSWWQRVTGVFTNPVRSVTSAVNYSADAAATQANNVQDAAAAYVPFTNYIANYDLQDAHANFTIKDGFLYSDNLVVSGSNLNVKLEMALKLADMTLNATLHPSFFSLLDTATAPFTKLPIHLIDINVNGPLTDLSWAVRFNDKGAIKKQMKAEVEQDKKKHP